MMLVRSIVVIWLLAQVTSVAAQDEVTAEPGASPSVLFLLDEVPNYAEVLRDQWSPQLPPDALAAETDIEAYGRLLDAQPKQPLTVAECVALAVQNNTNLQVRRLTPATSAVAVRQAWSTFDPVWFASVGKDRETVPVTNILLGGAVVVVPGSPTMAPPSIPTPTRGPAVVAGRQFTQNFHFNTGIRKTLLTGGTLELLWENNRFNANPSIVNPLVPQYTTALGLSLNQPLLRGFGWYYSLLVVDVAQAMAESTYHTYRADIANLVTSVERQYWALVRAIETVRVQEQGLEVARELQRQNEGRFNVGSLPQSSVLEARAEVARRESTLIRSRNVRDNERDNLRALINARNPNAPALLMIEPQESPGVPPYDIDLDRSLQSALEERPELLAARTDVRGRGLQRKIAENGLLPKFNFEGRIGLNGLSGRNPGATFNSNRVDIDPSLVGPYGRALEFLPDGRYYNYSAGATIEVPIDNSQAKADYAQANIELDQSRLRMRELEENITLEIKKAVSNLDSDLKSIEATRIARQLAEENLRDQQARYDVGLATTKDIVDFQERLTLAQFSEIEALTSYNTDLAEMRRVDGTLLEARNIIVERVSAGDLPWWARF